jgi:dienelactone hydrolase
MFRYRFFIIALLLLVPVSFSWAKAVPAGTDNTLETAQYSRTNETFESQGDTLNAWLYLPAGVSKPPVIVMAHGFGGQRWMRLPAYAERFARAGMAVLVFDYRGFGESEGQPRQYINPSRHLEDWDAAIAYVKTLEKVDAQRIALWGTSFSGGHVIVEAAKHPEVLAVVSQVPFTDGISTEWNYLKTSPLFAMKGVYHGCADVFVSLFTDGRHHVRIAGRPGEKFAMMSQPDSMDGLLKLLGGDITEKDFEKDNYCPGNILFTLGMYRPISYAGKINCPALIIGAEKDTLFPPDGPKKLADRMKKATYISMPMNHFDPYVDEPFEKLVKIMTEFLKANLTAEPVKQ